MRRMNRLLVLRRSLAPARKKSFVNMLVALPMALKSAIRLSPTGITAEGDRVEVESVSDVETLEAKRYLNQYRFLFELKNEKFIAIHNYMDPMLSLRCAG